MSQKKVEMRLEDVQDFDAKNAFEEWKKLGSKKLQH